MSKGNNRRTSLGFVTVLRFSPKTKIYPRGKYIQLKTSFPDILSSYNTDIEKGGIILKEKVVDLILLII